jgi:integrase
VSNLIFTINKVLQDLKLKLGSNTWESRRRYFERLVRLSEKLKITEPCQELYDAFIADDNNSLERRSMHLICVRLLDASAGTHAKDSRGILINQPPLPSEAVVQEFFKIRDSLSANSVPIDYLIVKAEIEMRYLNLSVSTIGQYRHSWMDIRHYYNIVNSQLYDDALIRNYLQEINIKRSHAVMKEWKWKINRKAAYVLIEVANTGRFQWRNIHENISFSDPEVEIIKKEYKTLLEQKNLSLSTIDLYDYVFRKTIEFANLLSLEDFQTLTSKTIQLVISKFSEKCNKRSMATILPILRSILKYIHESNLTKWDLSGSVIGAFIQRDSVATYISEKDQRKLIIRLDEESKRTKAIIYLALHLGLRDSDICNLTFAEIDWQDDKIRLNQKKTGKPLVLPLLSNVGNALMDYILNERPVRNDNYPYIFLRNQAPNTKLSSVYFICSNLIQRLGINPVNGNSKGIHLFRYSLVYKLLSAKVPYQVITDTLGHTSKDSDKPYYSMDECMLRMCALNLSIIGKITWKDSGLNEGL